MALLSLRPSLPLFSNPNPRSPSSSSSISLLILKHSPHRSSPTVRSSSSGHDPSPDASHRKQRHSPLILPLAASAAVLLIGLRARACPVLPSPAPVVQTSEMTTESSVVEDEEDFRAAFERWKSQDLCVDGPLKIVVLRGSIPPSWIKDFFHVQGKRLKFGSDYRGSFESIFSELSAASIKGVVESKSAMAADIVSVGDSWLGSAISDRLIEPIKNVEEEDWFKSLSDRWKLLTLAVGLLGPPQLLST